MSKVTEEKSMTRFLGVFCALLAAAVLAATPLAAGEPAQPPSKAESASEPAAAPAAGFEAVNIAYLAREQVYLPERNATQRIPGDEGLWGAKMGIKDNNTTGQFTKQDFRLKDVTVPAGGDIAAAFKKLAGEGYKFFVVNAPAADLLTLADLPEAKDAILFNAGSKDNVLRGKECRANVFHTASSRAMLTDALAEYLVKKTWTRWFLVTGQDPEDKLFADNIKRVAKKFRTKIVEEKIWDYNPEEKRRSAEAEIPVFTQGPDYQVLIVADEAGRFGDEFMYRTWDPRLVAGTQGLVPTDWDGSHYSWGAIQFQNRFEALSGRLMTAKDFAAWAAVRSVGEAATRTKSTDFKAVRDFILGPDFTLGVFKGVGASYRPWDHQLREPVLLATPHEVVAVPPLPEYIHPVTNLDTLGFDKPESECKFK